LDLFRAFSSSSFSPFLSHPLFRAALPPLRVPLVLSVLPRGKTPSLPPTPLLPPRPTRRFTSSPKVSCRREWSRGRREEMDGIRRMATQTLEAFVLDRGRGRELDEDGTIAFLHNAFTALHHRRREYPQRVKLISLRSKTYNLSKGETPRRKKRRKSEASENPVPKSYNTVQAHLPLLLRRVRDSRPAAVLRLEHISEFLSNSHDGSDLFLQRKGQRGSRKW
jgi:hypothetical protein